MTWVKLTYLISYGLTVFKFICCLMFIILLDGCRPCYYAPSAQNVPLFKEKNEGNGSIALRLSMRTIGCDMQGAFAITDHLGLMANYSYFSGRGSTANFDGEDLSGHFKSHLTEFGLGYYLPFKNKFLFETYGGYGKSWIENHYDYFVGNGYSTLGSSCFFIQPAVGFYKKNIRLAFSARFRGVNFNQVHFDSGLDQTYKEELLQIQDNPVVFFIEPAFTFRGGGEHVKIQVQIGLSFKVSDTELVYDPMNFNIGLIFNIHGKKKSETEP